MKLFFVGIACMISLAACTSSQESPTVPEASAEEIAKAVNLANGMFATAQSQGFDLEKGPCLSNELMPDWVLDIAHNPRDKTLDEDPVNQCSAYREGSAHHFVELDTTGKLIRVR